MAGAGSGPAEHRRQPVPQRADRRRIATHRRPPGPVDDPRDAPRLRACELPLLDDSGGARRDAFRALEEPLRRPVGQPRGSLPLVHARAALTRGLVDTAARDRVTGEGDAAVRFAAARAAGAVHAAVFAGLGPGGEGVAIDVVIGRAAVA